MCEHNLVNENNSINIWRNLLLVPIFIIGFLLGSMIDIDLFKKEPKIIDLSQDTNLNGIKYK